MDAILVKRQQLYDNLLGKEMLIETNIKKESAKLWKGGIILLLLSTVIFLVMAEIYFRLTSPHIIRASTTGLSGKEVSGDYSYFMDTLSGRRLTPNTHVVYVDGYRKTKIDINSHGFRGEEIPAIKKPDETRILVLGDSITFGVSTPKEYTYVERLEEYLAAKLHYGPIRIINGGVEGIGTKDEIDILVNQGVAISPDIVVVSFYLNDGNLPDRLAAGLANPGFIRRNSVLVQTIYRAYKFRQYDKGKMEEANMYGWIRILPPGDWHTNRNSLLRYAKVAKLDWGAAWEPSTWVVIEEQMKRLQVLAKEHNFKVVFAAFPISFQVYAGYVEDEPQQRLKILADKYCFQFFDLLPVFRASAGQRKLFLDWCHLTVDGHDVAGKALADFLSDRVLHQDRNSRNAN